jgi:hypothetical protein
LLNQFSLGKCGLFFGNLFFKKNINVNGCFLPKTSLARKTVGRLCIGSDITDEHRFLPILEHGIASQGGYQRPSSYHLLDDKLHKLSSARQNWAFGRAPIEYRESVVAQSQLPKKTGQKK